MHFEETLARGGRRDACAPGNCAFGFLNAQGVRSVMMSAQMKRFLLLTLIITSVLASGCLQLKRPGSESQQTAAAPTQAANAVPSQSLSPCALPRSQSLVTDNANVLTDSQRDEIERKLQNLKQSGKIDFALVVVDDTAGQDIFDYSLSLANCWDIGADNPDKAGVLLLVAVKDRKWRIQITRELEKVLSNAETKEIGDSMVPDFKKGDFASGLHKAVDTMIAALAKKRNFSVTTL